MSTKVQVDLDMPTEPIYSRSSDEDLLQVLLVNKSNRINKDNVTFITFHSILASPRVLNCTTDIGESGLISTAAEKIFSFMA